MVKEDLKEVRELIERYKGIGFRYAKPDEFLLKRINATKEEVEKEIISGENIQSCEKQDRVGEIRYVLYYIYSKRKGRVYVLTFEDRIVLVTAYPIGRTTLRRYKKRFKS